jgi:hypothetical protein
MALTYRQVACLMERYWDRYEWTLEVEAMMNPLGGGEDEDEGDSDSLVQVFKQPAIDATSDSGLAYLESEMNIPVKRRFRKG